jgi:ankyrin repeat protein
VNAKSKYGDTALIVASREGFIEAVQLLIKAGAIE